MSHEAYGSGPAHRNKGRLGAFGERAANMTRDGFEPKRAKQVTTLGWRPSCKHDAPTKPCVVFDPFLGSGTVGRVAIALGRRWVGLELSREYIEIAKRRVRQVDLKWKSRAAESVRLETQEAAQVAGGLK